MLVRRMSPGQLENDGTGWKHFFVVMIAVFREEREGKYTLLYDQKQIQSAAQWRDCGISFEQAVVSP